MKRVPLYRAPIAGLMSLALATTALPPTSLAELAPHANNPDDRDLGDEEAAKKGKHPAREER